MAGKKIFRSTAVILFSLFVAVTVSHPAAALHFWENMPDGDLIDEMTNALPDEELLGQVFFLGYVGKEPSPEIRHWVASRQLGGVKIFTRNVSTLTSLAASIRELQLLSQETRAKVPLFIATDQEGGWVRHIRMGASSTGGNLSLAAGGVPRDAYLTGFYLGEELKAMGVNMNFAPTLDVYSNASAAPGVGPRAFSSDPLLTAVLGAAYIQGQKEAGIIGTGKHFPGHGDARLDSHGYLPEIDIDADTLWNRELLPYRIAVREGLPAVMTAHLAFPRVTGRRIPASLDQYFIQDVLRGRLGFTGLIVTDDMEMNGALGDGDGVKEACCKALLAGNDMILVSHTPAVQERVWRHLLEKIESDARFKERIKNAVRRILALKLATFKGERPFPFLPDPKLIPALIPAPEASDFFFASACRGVTLVKKGLVPFRPAASNKILLVSQYSEFLEEGRKRFPAARSMMYSWDPMFRARPEDRERIEAAAAESDTIIFCLANPNGLEILRGLKAFSGKVIVVSALTPVYLNEAPWIETAVAVYGNAAASFKAGFAVLAGDFSPEGALPLSFPRTVAEDDLE